MRSGRGAEEDEEEEGGRAERKGWRGRDKRWGFTSGSWFKESLASTSLAPLFSSLASFYTLKDSWHRSGFSAGSLRRKNPPCAHMLQPLLHHFQDTIGFVFCFWSWSLLRLWWIYGLLLNIKAALIEIFIFTMAWMAMRDAIGVAHSENDPLSQLSSGEHFSIF